MQWFHDYNGRQTIAAGNKEEKTTFKVQHLMSRSAAGIRIQAFLTVFAANFVRWADEWIRPRIEQSTRRFDDVLSSPKRLVRIAANSPAIVDRGVGPERVRFSHLSSFDGVVIVLSAIIGRQLPLFANDLFPAPKRLGVWLRKTYARFAGNPTGLPRAFSTRPPSLPTPAPRTPPRALVGIAACTACSSARAPAAVRRGCPARRSAHSRPPGCGWRV
jgi:hypothetical protein